jgi:hypothetical protein
LVPLISANTCTFTELLGGGSVLKWTEPLMKPVVNEKLQFEFDPDPEH